ncbi:MAG TPA: TolC family protein [Verrucomicrobiae bacterium]|nr:TolC family protein [Verrucomicrobiae bacterium]
MLTTTVRLFVRIKKRAASAVTIIAGNSILCLLCCQNLHASPATNANEVVELRLTDYLQKVLDHNDTIQARILEAEAGFRRERAEHGIFEPQWDSSITRVINKRTNNVQQAAEQSGQFFFSERNTIYDTGVEALLPLGGKVRIGYTLSDLVNNVNPLGGLLTTTNNHFIQQYQTFIGVTLTQPLLKNAGNDYTLAGIRMAALESDIAFQEYRRQLMLTISQAESAYWNLYYAQEQLRFFQESVSVAESVLDDSQEKVKAGQGADLDVLEAQSGLALRKTKQNEALQSYYDAMSQVRAFTGAMPTEQRRDLRAVDIPATTNEPPSYAANFHDAFDLNPDFLIQRKKVAQENLRLGVARNQLLPELDLKAAYGYNGLGRTPGDSWDLVEGQNFPSWTVGAQLTIPLAGNIKGRNQFAAARLTYQSAVADLNGIQTEVANALDASLQKVRSWRDSIQSYETVVHFNESLLKTQRERLKVGTIEPRKVFEVEADLLDSRQNLAQALVQLQRTMLQLQVVAGSLLKERGLDMNRYELRQKTLALLREHKLPTAEYRPSLNVQPYGDAN